LKENLNEKETLMSKNKNNRVQVSDLRPQEKEVSGREAARVKGGAGNAGAGGGDVRSIKRGTGEEIPSAK
jgi:hypothetical protein